MTVNFYTDTSRRTIKTKIGNPLSRIYSAKQCLVIYSKAKTVMGCCVLISLVVVDVAVGAVLEEEPP